MFHLCIFTEAVVSIRHPMNRPLSRIFCDILPADRIFRPIFSQPQISRRIMAAFFLANFRCTLTKMTEVMYQVGLYFLQV